MANRPLVAVAVCWLIGASAPSLWSAYGSALALSGILMLLLGFVLGGRLPGKLALVCALAVMLSFGERLWAERGIRTELTAFANSGVSVNEAAVLTGRIASSVQVDGDSASFRLSVRQAVRGPSSENRAAKEMVMVRVKLLKQQEQSVAVRWHRGDSIRAIGALEKPSDSGNFGMFDYRAYQKRRNIHWQLAAKGADSITVAETKAPLSMMPMRQVDALRESIDRKMDLLFPDEDAGYMKGLVAGIQDDIDPEQYDDFAKLGLTHVLAISGLHVAVVVFALLRIGALLRLTRERCMTVAIAAMPIYMLLTGASASAVRACLMAMIALALARKNRLKDGLHLLAAAAVLMVVYDPLIVEEVSFQLSFAVTAGLLLFVPTVTALIPTPWKPIRNALSVALTAQIVSFPLTIHYFHTMHLLSLPANLVLVPFISFVVMPLGLAALLLGSIWLPLGILPARLATICNEATFRIVSELEGLEWARTVWPAGDWRFAAAAYALIGLTAGLIRRIQARKPYMEQLYDAAYDETAPLRFPAPKTGRMLGIRQALPALALFLLWSMWFIGGLKISILDASARVMFIDVGQGDGVLIRTGGGRYLMVDAGGTVSFRKPGEQWRDRRDPYEVGRKLLVPLLNQRGVRSLDALVLTHLDQDHIGGAKAVMESIPVRRLIFNGTLKDTPYVRELFVLALKKNIPLYAAQAGMSWRIDSSAKLDVLYPGEPAGHVVPMLDNQNERSIVLMLTLYGRRFLLPGDLESKGERETAAAYAGKAMSATPVDVLKAGHHGSKTSTRLEWLSLWKPTEAVISVGRNNGYGHPNPSVLKRLDAMRVSYFRTDRDGEVQYRVSPSGKLERRLKRKAGEPE